MVILECKIDNEKIIVMNSCGIKRIRNGEVIKVRRDDLTKPDIKFLLSKGILRIVGEESPSDDSNTAKSSVLFRCNLIPGRKLTLNSIKGSVAGGDLISIEKSNLNNSDIAQAIRLQYLIEVKQNEESKIEESKNQPDAKEDKKEQNRSIEEEQNRNTEEDKSESEKETKDIMKEIEDSFQEIKPEEISIADKKKEVPNSRINEDIYEEMKLLAEEIYRNNRKKSENKTGKSKTKKSSKVNEQNENSKNI